MKKAIIGKKVGMTQIFDDKGNVVPVTVVEAGPCVVTQIKTKETDFVEQVLATDSHSHLMLFTNKGKVHVMKAYRIPEAGKTAKGSNIVNMLLLEEGEKITTMISVPEFTENEYLLFVTKQGVVKRTPLSEYEYQRKGGKIALSLDEGDELVFVRRSQGDSDVLIATHEGNATRFIESDARPMGRTARGVRGIRLDEGDYVKGVALVEEDKMLITITEKGEKLLRGGHVWVYADEITALSQAPENRIQSLSRIAAFGALLPSTLPTLQKEERTLDQICGALSEMIVAVPTYALACLPNAEAAQLSYNTIFGV